MIGLTKSKVRLYLEYLVLALLLAVVGLAVTLKMQTYRQEISINNLSHGLDKANDEINVVRSVNEAQESVIQTLGSQRLKDNQVVDQLLETYDKLRDADQRIRSQLETLEKTDADAKAYFNSPIPESVACLYDDSCSKAGDDSKDRVPEADSPGGPITSLLLAPEEKAKGGEGSN